MKSTPLRLLALCAVLFGGAAAIRAWLSPGLPHARLGDGRELRVLHLSYGSGGDPLHDLPPTSASLCRFWTALPQNLRRFMPVPAPGISGVRLPGEPKTVSFWLASVRPGESYEVPIGAWGRQGLVFNSKSPMPSVNTQAKGISILKQVELARWNPDWNRSKSTMIVDGFCKAPELRTGVVRQFIIENPPRDLREFRFAVPAFDSASASPPATPADLRSARLAARENPIELKIPNPAYQKP